MTTTVRTYLVAAEDAIKDARLANSKGAMATVKRKIEEAQRNLSEADWLVAYEEGRRSATARPTTSEV